jgi:hypothetical protein
MAFPCEECGYNSDVRIDTACRTVTTVPHSGEQR